MKLAILFTEEDGVIVVRCLDFSISSHGQTIEGVKMSSVSVKGIIDQALKKTERERARIAETLILSLDKPVDKDVELAWQKEIGKRLKEIDSGAIQCIPWEDVRSQLYENA